MNHQQYNLPKLEMPVNPQGQDWVSAPNVVRTDKILIVKDFFYSNDNETYFGKGQKFNRTSVSGSVYSAAVSDYLMGITSLALAPTIGLPRPRLVGVGKAYIIKDEVGGAGTTTITIRSAGEENIDGATTTLISVNYASKSFYTDGANWFVI